MAYTTYYAVLLLVIAVARMLGAFIQRIIVVQRYAYRLIAGGFISLPVILIGLFMLSGSSEPRNAAFTLVLVLLTFAAAASETTGIPLLVGGLIVANLTLFKLSYEIVLPMVVLGSLVMLAPARRANNEELQAANETKERQPNFNPFRRKKTGARKSSVQGQEPMAAAKTTEWASKTAVMLAALDKAIEELEAGKIKSGDHSAP